MTATTPISPVHIANTRQLVLATPLGDYLVQTAWPAAWRADGSTDENVESLPILFALDGNAYFYTAVDTARRHEAVTGKRLVVVGIGYPDATAYDFPRRAHDYTPSSKNGQPGETVRDASPSARPSSSTTAAADAAAAAAVTTTSKIVYGGSADFLRHVVLDHVLPAVEKDLLPHLPVAKMPKTLFGHSFGGLFTLYTLYSGLAKDVFSSYIAASPSVWFNDRCLTHEYETPFLEGDSKTLTCNLLLTVGSAEQDPPKRQPDESNEDYERRRDTVARYRMVTNAKETAKRLTDSGRLGTVEFQAYDGEDHIRSAVCALQRGIDKLVNGWQ